ncbi:MAG: hypothetical protein HQ523_09475 [Lentisphaerae bacterium]|nr:hypothetical protein [Lentisphaerota bacterium]
MARTLTGKRALNKRLKDVQRELATVASDIRSLEQGKPVPRKRAAPERPRPIPAPKLSPPSSGIRIAEDEHDDHVESLLASQKNLPRPAPDKGRMEREERIVKERAEKVRDERFSDYLASSFEAGGPLRYERRIQRNKAVVLGVIVLVVLAWLIMQFGH